MCAGKDFYRQSASMIPGVSHPEDAGNTQEFNVHHDEILFHPKSAAP
jgi:hypothetical protein